MLLVDVELVENNLLYIYIFFFLMSYCQLNRDRLLREAGDRYHKGCGKEKAAKYYRNN